MRTHELLISDIASTTVIIALQHGHLLQLRAAQRLLVYLDAHARA
jgi:hypothetical protein